MAGHAGDVLLPAEDAVERQHAAKFNKFGPDRVVRIKRIKVPLVGH